MKVICGYSDWGIVKINGNEYMVSETQNVRVKRVWQVKDYGDKSMRELLGNNICKLPYDFSGELDDLSAYCYWKEVE